MIDHYLYEIENRINGKKYFGVTENIPRRFKKHAFDLVNSQHHNSHLQAAWDHYGAGSFKFNVIGYADNEEDICLDEMAHIWRNYGNTYNIALGNPDTKYSRYNPDAVTKTVNKHSVVLKPEFTKAKKEVPKKGSRFLKKLNDIIALARLDLECEQC
jgi:hypothetical protein